MNNENIFHAEFNDQMANLSNLHSVDITSINSNYQNQIFALENDILRLKELVDNKNREIEQ